MSTQVPTLHVNTMCRSEEKGIKVTEVKFNQGFSRNKEVSTESAGCIEKGKINSIVWHQQSFALEEMLGPQECEFARWVRG